MGHRRDMGWDRVEYRMGCRERRGMDTGWGDTWWGMGWGRLMGHKIDMGRCPRIGHGWAQRVPPTQCLLCPPAGGAPDPRALTAGQFSSGLSGCVRGLTLESAGIPRHPIDLRHGAVGVSPVPPCPS